MQLKYTKIESVAEFKQGQVVLQVCCDGENELSIVACVEHDKVYFECPVTKNKQGYLDFDQDIQDDPFYLVGAISEC